MKLISHVNSKSTFWFLGLVGLLTAFSIWRYLPWMPSVFFGDDLLNYLAFLDGNFASTPLQALTGIFVEKFRPIFSLVIGGFFELFGSQIHLYLVMNIFIQVVSAVIFFFIILQLSRGSFLVASLSSILAVTSRFSLWQVTQVTGLIEGLGTLFFLALIYCLIRFQSIDAKAASRSLFLPFCAIFFELLLIHTHERYFVVVPWMVCFFYLTPGFQRFSFVQRYLIFALLTVPALLSVLYKKVVMHTVFFVGTGGTHIQIDLEGMKLRLMEGIFSLFGFNYGPAHLVGRTIATEPDTLGWQVAFLFSVCWIAIVLFAARSVWLKRMRGSDNDNSSIYLPCMLLALIGLLLLPPLMTIRMEQRWLVQPFLILLMVVAWSVSVVVNRMKQWCLAFFVGLFIASFTVDLYSSRSFPSLFFVSSGRLAEVIKRDVMDVDFSGKPLIFLGVDPGFCQWVLGGGSVFRLYRGSPRDVKCFADKDELYKNIDLKEQNDFKIFDLRLDGATDITRDVYKTKN